jgi:chorismate dehydratase
MSKLRVGFVKYLNTLPLVQGLDAAAGLELVPAVPSRLGEMLAARELDCALCSLVDYATSPVPLTLLTSGAIGCDGPTLTVRVFSTLPPQEITTLHADTDSHTSVVLARLLLRMAHRVEARIADYHARERVGIEPGKAPDASGHWPPSLLLIGDKVVTDAPPPGQYAHEIDLGDWWKRDTGLPFVYAAWMCRREDQARPELAQLAALLERQRLRNTFRTGWLIDRAVTQRRWPRELAHHYVTHCLRYELGPRQREAIAFFLAQAGSMDLIPLRAPSWLETQHAAPASP